MKNILENYNDKQSLRCPSIICGSLQTYYLKKEDKMCCRRCGNKWPVKVIK